MTRKENNRVFEEKRKIDADAIVKESSATSNLKVVPQVLKNR